MATDWKNDIWSDMELNYAKFFGGEVKSSYVTNKEIQKSFDRVLEVTRENGDKRYYTVEEKSRSKTYTTNDGGLDIAIEFVSGNILGWIYTCKADFLVYHWADTQRAVFLKGFELQKAWKRFGMQWVSEFGMQYTQNRRRLINYKTYFCPVRFSTLTNYVWLWGYSPKTQAGKFLSKVNYLDNW